jgi:hypothetical protein
MYLYWPSRRCLRPLPPQPDVLRYRKSRSSPSSICHSPSGAKCAHADNSYVFFQRFIPAFRAPSCWGVKQNAQMSVRAEPPARYRGRSQMPRRWALSGALRAPLIWFKYFSLFAVNVAATTHLNWKVRPLGHKSILIPPKLGEGGCRLFYTGQARVGYLLCLM